MSSAGVASADECTNVIKKLLFKANDVKPDGAIEPALTVSSCRGEFEEIQKLSQGGSNRSYAAIETACRNIFYNLLASTAIDTSSFGQVWNLFDFVSIISDSELCEPGLVFWLVEELLDSQTIDGCRIVFDYLDSRRDRITAKHFKQKNLIILRSCNELLRRLSRAEDTVFCGRVFIFLFQSFPLGDKSSVNLRGEFHIENTTAYEDLSTKVETNQKDGMELDQKQGINEEIGTSQGTTEAVTASEEINAAHGQTIALPEIAEKDHGIGKPQDAVLDLDSLYSMFWSLQETFSTPTRLFDESNLSAFKIGLESTIAKFREVQRELEARGPSKLPDESKRGVKRKRNGQEDEFSASFNPKYLTSRDLFDLEISDLAFRRHILVQALILVDFLLSLTPKAKKKLEHTTNKSVLYAYTLNEENVKWATSMRNDIASYLQQGPEGKFYYRMVDTVLSRDKNWVHWKAEGCPPIERAPVSAEDFSEAKKGAQKACMNKRIRQIPLGTLDLKFLSDAGEANGMEKLKDPERYSVPTAESFKGPIAEDEFDLEMAKSKEDKQLAADARASKLWRTLRIASKTKLNVFDKIDDGNNLQALFRFELEENGEKADENGEKAEVNETEGSDQFGKANVSAPTAKSEQKPVDESRVEKPKEAVVK